MVVSRDQASVRLQVSHGGEIDFVYAVVPSKHPTPDEALLPDETDSTPSYTRAEVHLNEGSQSYDIMGRTQEQILNDVLEHYEKHLHFLHVLR